MTNERQESKGGVARYLTGLMAEYAAKATAVGSVLAVPCSDKDSLVGKVLDGYKSVWELRKIPGEVKRAAEVVEQYAPKVDQLYLDAFDKSPKESHVDFYLRASKELKEIIVPLKDMLVDQANLAVDYAMNFYHNMAEHPVQTVAAAAITFTAAYALGVAAGMWKRNFNGSLTSRWEQALGDMVGPTRTAGSD